MTQPSLFGTQILDVEPIDEKTPTPKNELDVIRQFFGLDLSEDELAEIELGNMTIEVDKETGKFVRVKSRESGGEDKIRHRMVAFLLGRGFSYQKISDLTGYAYGTVVSLCQTPFIKEMASLCQGKIMEKISIDRDMAMAQIGAASIEAANKQIDLMRNSKNERVQLNAAVKLLEAIGMYDKKKGEDMSESDELVQIVLQAVGDGRQNVQVNVNKKGGNGSAD